jgi:hypothetical protein
MAPEQHREFGGKITKAQTEPSVGLRLPAGHCHGNGQFYGSFPRDYSF